MSTTYYATLEISGLFISTSPIKHTYEDEKCNVTTLEEWNFADVTDFITSLHSHVCYRGAIAISMEALIEALDEANFGYSLEG